MILKVQQHILEVQIENLQRALFMEKEAVQELDATRERLAGMERVCQELREENHRLEDDISRWQVRPAAANGCGGSDFSDRWRRGKDGQSIDLSLDDSATSVHVAQVTGSDAVFDNFLQIIFIRNFLKSASPSVTRHLSRNTMDKN